MFSLREVIIIIIIIIIWATVVKIVYNIGSLTLPKQRTDTIRTARNTFAADFARFALDLFIRIRVKLIHRV